MDNFDFKTCFMVVVDPATYYDGYLNQWSSLRTSLKHSRQLNGEHNSSDTNFVACLKWYSCFCGPQNQFVTVEIIQNNGQERGHRHHGLGGGIVLYACPQFIQRYRLDTASSDHGFKVKRMNIVVPLTSATISVSDQATYERLLPRRHNSSNRSDHNNHCGQPDWSTKLLLSACKGPAICRRGNVISLEVDDQNDNYCRRSWTTVLDSEPVDQGVLAPSTSLTIIQTSATLFGTTDEVHQKHNENSNISINDNHNRTKKSLKLDYLSYLLFLAYTVKLFATIASNSPQSKRTKFARLLGIAFIILGSWRLKFKIIILARNPIKMGSKPFETMDILNFVFMSSNILRRHALSDFSWAYASLSTSVRNNWRPVRLCSIERSAADLNLQAFGSSGEDVCHMTPQLWFNLNAHPSTLVQPETNLFIKKYSGPSPTYARTIHVSLVQSPRYSSLVDSGRHLNSYFKIPRLMCHGDLFCLQIDGASSDNIHLKMEQNLLYFRVKRIEGDSIAKDFGSVFLVDREHSILYQEGISQAFVPNTMEDFWSSNNLHPIWDSPMPHGFHQFSTKLVNTISPFLKSASLRRTTLLTICLVGPRGSGKMISINALIKQLNLHLVLLNCWEFIGESAGATASRIQAALQKVTAYAPCCVILKDVDLISRDDSGIANGESRVLYAFKEALRKLSEAGTDYPVIIIGTTTDVSLLGPDLASIFLHFLEPEVSGFESRSEILRVLLSPLNVGMQVSLTSLVQKSSGYILGDLCALVNSASSAAHERIAKLTNSGDHLISAKEEVDICLAGPRILNCDFDQAFDEIQSALSVAIGAPKIPSVKWDDIGGLEDVKAEILDTVQLPLKHPELLATGMRRSGVLLYGPPGTGKTLLAKAVATECSLNFLSVKGPELINMYVGQSEENVRKIFRAARSAAPCIIFFDELDSLAPNRGRSGDSGGVMDRVVSQLLSEMDGLHCTKDVFVMGATNRPDLLDPALLRPGRLDKSLYVGICADKSAQLKILTALTRKFHLTDDVKLLDIVNACPSNITGADFYALCSEALLNAISREVQCLEETGICEPEKALSVTSQDFSLALQNLTPSVSDDDLQHYSTVLQKMRQ